MESHWMAGFSLTYTFLGSKLKLKKQALRCLFFGMRYFGLFFFSMQAFDVGNAMRYAGFQLIFFSIQKFKNC